MGITEEGIEAEQWLLKFLHDKGITVFQPDAMSFEENVWIVNEMKHQEPFDPPPFKGHGLPRWQIEARMKFWMNTDIRVRLIVKEKNTFMVYWQWLDLLENGKFFDTFGKKPRRIYPIESFNIWK